MQVKDTARIKSEDMTVFPAEKRIKNVRPLFALKTNLLYDAGLALNASIEIPLGTRWSLSGEWIFPWWLWERKQYAFELLYGNLEARYWWGNREKREVLTGWFTGLNAGGGYYDLESGDKGYQGEFFSVSLTGGYAHKIGRRLSLEYSLGLGYMDTKYREYVPVRDPGGEWHLIKQRNGNFSWIGPVSAKISLVWMLTHKKNAVSPKSKFLNDAIIQMYFPNWVKLPGLTKNLHS